MNSRFLIRRTAAIAAVLLFFQIGIVSAAERIQLQTGSTLSLAGDSTLHPFTCNATQLNLSTVLDTSGVPPPATESAVWQSILEKGILKEWKLDIPVQGLKSGESGLDKNMYKALKAKEYPEIIFGLSSYEVQGSTDSNSSASLIQAKGTLQISGQERAIELQGRITPQAQGFRLEGQYTLLMTDYGIKPPTLLMGTIKVKNPIVIHFDLRLQMDSK